MLFPARPHLCCSTFNLLLLLLLLLSYLAGGTPPRVTPVVVNINVLDENDNSPICPPGSLTASVEENLPAGQIVVQVTATQLMCIVKHGF